MHRFIMVNAAHIVVKYSDRMRRKYLSLVRRLGKNRAIVAIARILLETIYTMLKKGEHFVDQIDTLTGYGRQTSTMLVLQGTECTIS